ncbi:MAG: hypothetical protein ACR2M6_02690 [Vampirovibrionia bacterium]
MEQGEPMKLTMNDVFLIRTQEYKNIHYALGKNREANFFYYKDNSKEEIHNIRMIYYLDNISKEDYEFFQFVIEVRKHNMKFDNFNGIVPPEVNRSKTKLYSYKDQNFKLNDKGVDYIKFMKDNQHLKSKQEIDSMNTYDLINYHITCFKMWMLNQNG